MPNIEMVMSREQAALVSFALMSLADGIAEMAESIDEALEAAEQSDE